MSLVRLSQWLLQYSLVLHTIHWDSRLSELVEMEVNSAGRGKLISFLRKLRRRPGGSVAVGIDPQGLCLIRLIADSGSEPRLDVVDFCQLTDPGQGAERLRTLVQQHRLKGARCYTVLDPHAYKLIQIESPQVPADELDGALRWRVKDLLDYPLDQAVIDSFAVPSDNQPGRPQQRYVVAAHRDQIAERVALIKQAGLDLQAIDISELALRNVAAFMPESQSGVAVLHLQEGTGAISLYQEGDLYLTRYLDVGSRQLQDAALSGEELLQYESVTLEIQRSLDFYESHFSLRPIHTLVVAPMRQELPGLLEHLIGGLGISVRQLDLSALVKGPQPFPETLQAQCLTTLGSALREAANAAG